MEVVQQFNSKIIMIEVINLLFAQMEFILLEKKQYFHQTHLNNQTIQERLRFRITLTLSVLFGTGISEPDYRQIRQKVFVFIMVL